MKRDIILKGGFSPALRAHPKRCRRCALPPHSIKRQSIARLQSPLYIFVKPIRRSFARPSSFPNPKGIPSQSPGLARAPTLGQHPKNETTATRLHPPSQSFGFVPGRNRVAVIAPLRFTQGFSCRATLGFATESRWNSRKGSVPSLTTFCCWHLRHFRILASRRRPPPGLKSSQSALARKIIPRTYAELRSGVKEVLLVGQRRIEQAKVRTYWEEPGVS